MKADRGKFRKVGLAYCATDDYSTLWVRKVDGTWRILWRSPNDGWRTLGKYSRLTDALSEGNALMGEPLA